MSTITRSRSAAGSIVTLKSCGPRSPITARWTWVFSSANGSRGAGLDCRPGRGETLVEFHQFFLPKRRRRPGAGSLLLGPDELFDVATRDEAQRELAKRRRRVGRRLGEGDRHALVDGARDLAVARDEDVGLAAEDARDVALADPDLALGAVEDDA